MHRAIELSKNSVKTGGGPFGAVIAKDGRMTVSAGLKTGEIVVSSGAHHVTDGERVEVVGRPSSSNVGGLL